MAENLLQMSREQEASPTLTSSNKLAQNENENPHEPVSQTSGPTSITSGADAAHKTASSTESATNKEEGATIGNTVIGTTTCADISAARNSKMKSSFNFSQHSGNSKHESAAEVTCSQNFADLKTGAATAEDACEETTPGLTVAVKEQSMTPLKHISSEKLVNSSSSANNPHSSQNINDTHGDNTSGEQAAESDTSPSPLPLTEQKNSKTNLQELYDAEDTNSNAEADNLIVAEQPQEEDSPDAVDDASAQESERESKEDDEEVNERAEPTSEQEDDNSQDDDENDDKSQPLGHNTYETLDPLAATNQSDGTNNAAQSVYGIGTGEKNSSHLNIQEKSSTANWNNTTGKKNAYLSNENENVRKQLEGLSEVCISSPASATKASDPNQKQTETAQKIPAVCVFKNAMEFLTKQFNIDPRTCEKIPKHILLKQQDAIAKGEDPSKFMAEKPAKPSQKNEVPNSYEQVLARNRPQSPSNQPMIYSCYLQNMVHTISRKVKGETKVICELGTQWKSGANAARVYQEQITNVPRIKRMMCRSRGCKGDALDRVTIKLLRENETDRKLPGTTAASIGLSASQNAHVGGSEQQKVRFWDAEANSEVTMERAFTQLNIKVHKLRQPPTQPDMIPTWFYPVQEPVNLNSKDQLVPARGPNGRLQSPHGRDQHNSMLARKNARFSDYKDQNGQTLRSAVRLVKSPRTRTKSQAHLHSSEVTTATTASGRTLTHVSQAINSEPYENKIIKRKLRIPTADTSSAIAFDLRSMMRVVRHSSQRAMRRKTKNKDHQNGQQQESSAIGQKTNVLAGNGPGTTVQSQQQQLLHNQIYNNNGATGSVAHNSSQNYNGYHHHHHGTTTNGPNMIGASQTIQKVYNNLTGNGLPEIQIRNDRKQSVSQNKVILQNTGGQALHGFGHHANLHLGQQPLHANHHNLQANGTIVAPHPAQHPAAGQNANISHTGSVNNVANNTNGGGANQQNRHDNLSSLLNHYLKEQPKPLSQTAMQLGHNGQQAATANGAAAANTTTQQPRGKSTTYGNKNNSATAAAQQNLFIGFQHA